MKELFFVIKLNTARIIIPNHLMFMKVAWIKKILSFKIASKIMLEFTHIIISAQSIN